MSLSRLDRFGAALAALAAGLVCVAGCDDSSSTPTERTFDEPSLFISARGECVNTLPVVTNTDLANRTFTAAAIVARGNTPLHDGGEYEDGTPITFSIADSGGDTGNIAFLSRFDADRDLGATETTVTFEGGAAADGVFCTRAGIVSLAAVVPSHGEFGNVEADRVFPIICIPQDEYACQCRGECVEDADIPDAGPLDAVIVPDMAPPDAVVVFDADPAADAEPADAAPVWTMVYESPPGNDLSINIRGAFGAGRADRVELVFRVAGPGGPVAGANVQFTLGANAPSNIELVPNEITSDVEGLARVLVVAGGTPGVFAVNASSEFGGREQSAQSPAISVRGGIPSYSRFDFACDRLVTPAFFGRGAGPGGYGLVLKSAGNCTAHVSDRLGGRVEAGQQIFFMTEAGNVTQTLPTDDSGMAQTELRVGHPAPADVRANIGAGEAFDAVSGFNGRDGWVTIVASTRGEEAFVDTDGNGIYDRGIDVFLPALHDLPEPFVDSDDSGTWEEGELFRDLNQDGQWNIGNNDWDNNTEIWVQTRMLWTGTLAERVDIIERGGREVVVSRDVVPTCSGGANCSLRGGPGIALCPPGLDIALGDRGTVYFDAEFTDVNLNCVASLAEGRIEVSTTNGALLVRPGSFEDLALLDCFNDNGIPRAPGFAFEIHDSEGREVGDEPKVTEELITVTLTYPDATGFVLRRAWEFSVCVSQ